MYKLKDINYKLDYLSSDTLMYHKELYKRYMERLNNLLIKNNYDFRYPKEELVNHLDIFYIDDRDDILFNLGGVLNHELYFDNISPGGENVLNNKFLDDMNFKYKSFSFFKNIFKETADKLIGSGYTALVLDTNNDFKIINVSNQETPYLYGYKPIIMLGLWEHAYYLDYNVNKSVYIDKVLDNLNISKINSNYMELINK